MTTQKDKENLLASLRLNLTNDYTEELTQQQIDYSINLFSRLVDKKQKEGLSENDLAVFVNNQTSSRPDKKQLLNAIKFLLDRSKGKYGLFGTIFGTLGGLLDQFVPI